MRRFDAVNLPQQLEGIRHRHVPPELAALAEHHADLGHVLSALLLRNAAVHHAASAVGHENAAENFDG